ncbi:energy transducer TonB [Spirosoma gilvum]
MKRFTFLTLSLIVSVCIGLASGVDVLAQSQSKIDKVYTVAERQPEFPGGTVALSRYLAENIVIPNALARKRYDTGPVAAKFIIDELGYIHDIRIQVKPLDKKGRRGMEAFMANIIAAVEKMPRWTPGEVGGRPVPVYYTLPIEITMQ